MATSRCPDCGARLPTDPGTGDQGNVVCAVCGKGGIPLVLPRSPNAIPVPAAQDPSGSLHQPQQSMPGNAGSRNEGETQDSANTIPGNIGREEDNNTAHYRRCPFCAESMRVNAVKCRHCGEFLDGGPGESVPVPSRTQDIAPPRGGMACRQCGSTEFKKAREAKSEGAGCLIALFGILITVPTFNSPAVIIGVFVILFGLHIMCKCDGFWVCRNCGSKYPRKLSWFELG